MGVIRRLDHVAIAVTDTARAVSEFRSRLGLRVLHSETLTQPPVRLTYLDAGNCAIQLVEPLDPSADVARWLDVHGEGLHHICFGVDSVPDAIAALTRQPVEGVLGTGRGRVSGFVADAVAGVRVECTEFRYHDDVAASPGWLERGD